MFGKSTMIDYDRLRSAVAGAFGSGGGWKPIPKPAEVSVTIPASAQVGDEFEAVAEPDEGYEMALSYIDIHVPEGVEANVIVETSEGKYPLLANNVLTDVHIDASDFLGLAGIRKLTLYVKVISQLAEEVTASMEFAGRQVRTGGGA